MAQEQVHTGEVCGIAGSWLKPDVVSTPGLGQPPGFDHVDLVSEEERFGWIVGDEEPRTVERLEMTGQGTPQPGSARDVDGCQGFIEEQQVRLGDQ